MDKTVAVAVDTVRIVLVDDSHPFLKALSAILQEAGYRDIQIKQSAQEVIDYLETTENIPGGKRVDIILMDVMMPQIDGIEAVRRIKSRPHLQDIPIIMVSAGDDEEKIEQAFSAGAIDFIGKPIKKLELRARVRSALCLKEEMAHRKRHEMELQKTVDELKGALIKVKTLSGLLPICSFCKKVRDDKGYWEQVENYVARRSDVDFSHSVCPDCVRQHYPGFADEILGNAT